MINENSLQAVKNACFSNHFLRPLYSGYCFSNLPQTFLSLFSSKPEGLPADAVIAGPYDHVVFLFLDGFGWRFFEEYKTRIPFLKRCEDEGIVSKLTSMFPSTTAAHVTCIHSGLPPSVSGIYEWFMYEPRLDEMIAPLPFQLAGDKKNDSLPLEVAEIFPQKTLYHTLKERGIIARAYQPQGIVDSVYSRSLLKEAEVYGYKNVNEGLNSLLSHLKPKSYSCFYFADIDSIGHRRGVHSEEFSQAIISIFPHLETFIAKLPPRTACLISADHGMVEVSPQNTFYLNREIPNVEKHFMRNQKNRPLAPAGSCRDFFLHILPENLRECKEILEEFLENKAEVHLTEDLIAHEMFGPGACSQKFLERVGNLVILPHAGEAVWWFERHKFQQNFYAAHGGLTPQEMEIPLLFLHK
jgi:predicted AlkP superfamily pyrophosphatase or phosphodiesterase